MKKGGEPGEVAINAELVTHVKSAAGPFTDIYFGEHRVAVEGSFQDTVNKLAGDELIKPPVSRDWVHAGFRPRS